LDAKVRLSVQPVKVNLDQDTAFHLFTFFTELSQLSIQDEPVYRDSSPTSQLQDENSETLTEKKEIFFKDVTFSPDLSVRVDYQVNNIDAVLNDLFLRRASYHFKFYGCKKSASIRFCSIIEKYV